MPDATRLKKVHWLRRPDRPGEGALLLRHNPAPGCRRRACPRGRFRSRSV